MARIRQIGFLCVFMGLCAGLCAAQSVPKVSVERGTLRLPTYPWLDDRNPVFSAYEPHIYYPYTRQDFILPTKEDRDYKAIYLENEYLKIICLPELGGRIHSVFDKTTGEEMFHKNNEIKPALIAMRGAWISGGIEWNAGPQGHTVHIVSPVDVTTVENEDGSATLVIGNTDKMFGTRWTVRLTLHPGKAYLDESIRMYNPTDGTHPYYFWNCTAFPNLEGTRFIYPMTLGCDHAGTTFFNWPIDKEKDITFLRNYPHMSSVFAYDCVFDFFGAYDVDRNRGIVSQANHLEVKGKKAWTWGKDDFGVTSQMALSDAGPVNAQYIEVQSGPLLTQAEFGMLGPHVARSWREFWYPVHGLGAGFEYATRDVAAQAVRTATTLEIKAIATAEFPGAQATLSKDGKVLLQQTVDLSPKQAVALTLPTPPEGAVRVEFKDAQGMVLLDYETPLTIPEVKAPDLTKKPAREDAQPTADELYEKANLSDRQSEPIEARQGYEAVLKLDPAHEKALCALATLDIEEGRYADAEAHARKALDRNNNNGAAWYGLGVAQLDQDRPQDARVSGYKAAHTLEAVALGYTLAARAAMRMGDTAEALSAAKRAFLETPNDPYTQRLLFAARYACGERESLLPELKEVVERGDPTDFVAHALCQLAQPDKNAFAQALNAAGGEREFTALKTAEFFADLGQFEQAAALLEACAQEGFSPWFDYVRAFYLDKSGAAEPAKKTFQEAKREDYARTFPSGPASRPVVAWALARQPKDTLAWLWLGDLEASLGNPGAAKSAWTKAVELDPKYSEAWRSLALHAQKKDNDPNEAERCYRKAIEAAPDDQLSRFELAALLEQRDKRAEALAIAETVPKDVCARYDLALWRAEAYVKEKRYTDALDFLATAQFSNWEGQTRPHDIFVSALVGRGKASLESKDPAKALADFELALTYPENLHVGARYILTDAEVRFWQGKALLELGRKDDARQAWKTGAAQPDKSGAAPAFVTVTDTQDEYKKKCATALEVLGNS